MNKILTKGIGAIAITGAGALLAGISAVILIGGTYLGLAVARLARN